MNGPTSGWPEYERRRYEWNNALGDFWLALSDHPLVGLIGPLRREFAKPAPQTHSGKQQKPNGTRSPCSRN